MQEGQQGAEWLAGGATLLIAFPVAMVVLAELSSRLAGTRWNGYREPIRLLRMQCLPALFLLVLLRSVVGMESSSIAVRVADTAFWIMLANFVLSATNVAFFEQGMGDGALARTPKLLLDLVRAFLVLLAAAIVISVVWGVDLGGLLTALGVGSIVIGLALQDTLGSIFAGIALLSSRQLRVGDWVLLGPHEGRIANMNWRSVTVDTLLGDRVIVPNSSVSKERMTVFGVATGVRWASAECILAYEHPPQRVMDLLIATAKAVPGIAQDPAPIARLVEFGDYGIKYAVWFAVADVHRVGLFAHEIRCNFWYVAQREGLIFPARYNWLYGDGPMAAEGSRGRSGAGEAEGAKQLAREIAGSGAIPRNPEALEGLAARGRRVLYRGGETVALAGAPLRHVWIVLDGVVSVVTKQATGDGAPASNFRTGQVVVFPAALHHGTLPFDLRADCDVVAIELPADDFATYLAKDQPLADQIEHLMSLNEQVLNGANGTAAGAARGKTVGNRGELLQQLFGIEVVAAGAAASAVALGLESAHAASSSDGDRRPAGNPADDNDQNEAPDGHAGAN